VFDVARGSGKAITGALATSFVSPKAVPNLRDAEEVMAGIARNPDVSYVALVPNARGAERALAADADEMVLVVSMSETHNRANVRRRLRSRSRASPKCSTSRAAAARRSPARWRPRSAVRSKGSSPSNR